MPKCQKLLEKAKRKGQECGIYTNKEFNGKFYCSSHIKSFISPSDIKENDKIIEKPIEKPIETTTDTPIKNNELTISLENGYSLDEVIQNEYENYKEPIKTEYDDINKKIDQINDKILFIENHLKYGKNKPMNIPEFEIWK